MPGQATTTDNSKSLPSKNIKNPLIGVVAFLFLSIIFIVSYLLFAGSDSMIFHFNDDTSLSVTSPSQMLNFDLDITTKEDKTEVETLFFEYYLEDSGGVKVEPETAGWNTVFNTLADATDRCLRPYENASSLEIRKATSCSVADTSFAAGRHEFANIKVQAPADISTFNGYKLVIKYSETRSNWTGFDSSGSSVADHTEVSGIFEIPIIHTGHSSEEIYLDPDIKQFENRTTGDISIKINTPQDIVAIGADIVVDDEYMEIVSLSPASSAFPIEQNEIIDSSRYRMVLGSYGNGRLGDGSQNPTSDNPVGFVGNDEEVAVLTVRFIKETPSGTYAHIKLENVSFILDNASGDESLPAVTDGSYEILPENLFVGESVISQEVYCEADGTKLRIKFVASGFDDLRVKINDGSVMPVSPVRNISGTVKEYEGVFDISAQEGKYSILQDDGTTYLSKDAIYNCLLEKGKLKIVDEVATPFSTSAKITFSTIGGPSNGKANGRIVSIIDQSGSSTGDWNPAEITDSLFHDFVVYNLEPETSYEAKLRADSVPAGETDEVSVFFTTRESLTERKGNTSLTVTRDRTCNKWLSCNSSVEVIGPKGNKETLCFDIGVCSLLDSDGRCLNPLGIGEEGFFGGNQNYVSPVLAASQAGSNQPEKVAELAENTFKNLSGYSKVGMDFGNEKTIEGYRHYADMPTIGQDIRVINGDLETGTAWPWEPNGLGMIEVSDDIYSTNANVSSNILRVDADLDLFSDTSTQYSGAKINLGYVSRNVDYVLSFDSWTENPNGEEIVVQVAREDSDGRLSYRDLFTEDILPFKQRITARINTQIDDGITSLVINKKNVRNDGSRVRKEDFAHSFYIDNVSMLPALAYQYDTDGENKIVSRSCRLFPTEDSKACDVLSGSSKKYYGWKGFCVEEDPRNENLCLNWYPVDVIKGEANAFGSDKQVGYIGRAPLYYCLESAGDAPYHAKSLVGEKKSRSEGVENWDPPLGDFGSYKIHRDQIVEIKVDGVDMDVDGNAHSDCNIIAAVDYGCADIASLPRGASENTGALVFNSENKAYWEREMNDSCGNNEGGASGLNKYITLRCSGKGKENDNNMISGGLVFDGNGYLQNIKIHFTDGGPKKGAAKFTSIKISYLGERCNVITQVVDPYGKNYAWANRLSDNGWKIDNPLDYEYETDYYPYGAAVPPGPSEENPNIDPNNPDTWPSPLFVMPPDRSSGMYAPYQSRAGFPYSIASNRVAPISSESWKTCSKNDSIRCVSDEQCGEGYLEGRFYIGTVTSDNECDSGSDNRDILLPSGETSVTPFVGRSCLVQSDDGGTPILKNGIDLTAHTISLTDCPSGSGCPFEQTVIPGGNPWTGYFSDYDNLVLGSGDFYMGAKPGAPDNGTCSIDHNVNITIPDQRPIQSQCVAGLAKKLGQPCDNNSDCGYSDDGSFGLCIGYDFSDEQIVNLSGGYERGIANLDGLFAKSIMTWKWSFANNKYEPFEDGEWDVTGQKSPPEIRNVVINGRQDDAGDEIVYSSTLNTVLEFNTFVKTDQIPLTYYSVDWGDGHITEMNNLKIAPRLDPDNPFVMLHSYDKKSCGGVGCQPVITIRDNWDSLTTYNAKIIIKRQ